MLRYLFDLVLSVPSELLPVFPIGELRSVIRYRIRYYPVCRYHDIRIPGVCYALGSVFGWKLLGLVVRPLYRVSPPSTKIESLILNIESVGGG
jgi:hypothetical protein